MATITIKKPRKIKANSIVNNITQEDNYNITQENNSNINHIRPAYTLVKDKNDFVSMEQRNKNTEEDIKLIDLTKYKTDEIPVINDFICSLSQDEKKAMLIAIDHLGTSFDIVRCNLFQHFIKGYKR